MAVEKLKEGINNFAGGWAGGWVGGWMNGWGSAIAAACRQHPPPGSTVAAAHSPICCCSRPRASLPCSALLHACLPAADQDKLEDLIALALAKK
jgi:hypothetical protein